MADGSWSLADAKAKLGEVVDRAMREGPQRITRHGRPAVVVVTEDEWSRVSGRGRTLKDVLLDPNVRGLMTDEEREVMLFRDPANQGRPIAF
jgi:antitoxin Phd